MAGYLNGPAFYEFNKISYLKSEVYVKWQQAFPNRELSWMKEFWFRIKTVLSKSEWVGHTDLKVIWLKTWLIEVLRVLF